MTPKEARAQAELFLGALGRDMPEEERLIVCGFPGDPNAAGPTAWRPHPWQPGMEFPFAQRHNNGYCTVGSFGRAQDGSFRRRTETFRAGRALMVDDVGTKVSPDIVNQVQPTAIVETSPGNFQWWYLLEEPERDAARFDGVIRAFITGKLLGSDPGMAGIARVGRVPGFLNGKAAYCTEERPGGFRVELREMNDRLFNIDGLLRAFKLEIYGRRDVQGVDKPRLPPPNALERMRGFYAAHAWLTGRAMLKKDQPDWSGWTEMTCPWVENHTAAADTGAAVREPDDANGFYGAFRCHHGGCADRGWKDLTDWINDEAVDELERANAAPNPRDNS